MKSSFGTYQRNLLLPLDMMPQVSCDLHSNANKTVFGSWCKIIAFTSHFNETFDDLYPILRKVLRKKNDRTWLDMFREK